MAEIPRRHGSRRPLRLAAALLTAAWTAAGPAFAGDPGRAAGPTPASRAAAPAAPDGAGPAVTDDLGREVRLAAPARRAIALAPHAAELVYAAGAGAYLAGTVRGTDYPPAARGLPSLGDGTRPSLEMATALRPDLAVAWQPALAAPLERMLAAHGVPVYYSDPRTLADIPAAIEDLGVLFGTAAAARRAADDLRRRLGELGERYRNRPLVRVFIQAGASPLYTINGRNALSDAVALCGGVNIFAGLSVPAPQVGLEAVLAAAPQAVVSGGPPAPELLAAGLRPIVIDPDLLYRAGPRLADAARQLCEGLEAVRGPR